MTRDWFVLEKGSRPILKKWRDLKFAPRSWHALSPCAMSSAWRDIQDEEDEDGDDGHVEVRTDLTPQILLSTEQTKTRLFLNEFKGCPDCSSGAHECSVV